MSLNKMIKRHQKYIQVLSKRKIKNKGKINQWVDKPTVEMFNVT